MVTHRKNGPASGEKRAAKEETDPFKCRKPHQEQAPTSLKPGARVSARLKGGTQLQKSPSAATQRSAKTNKKRRKQRAESEDPHTPPVIVTLVTQTKQECAVIISAPELLDQNSALQRALCARAALHAGTAGRLPIRARDRLESEALSDVITSAQPESSRLACFLLDNMGFCAAAPVPLSKPRPLIAAITGGRFSESTRMGLIDTVLRAGADIEIEHEGKYASEHFALQGFDAAGSLAIRWEELSGSSEPFRYE